jgi:hypothetical protein
MVTRVLSCLVLGSSCSSHTLLDRAQPYSATSGQHAKSLTGHVNDTCSHPTLKTLAPLWPQPKCILWCSRPRHEDCVSNDD